MMPVINYGCIRTGSESCGATDGRFHMLCIKYVMFCHQITSYSNLNIEKLTVWLHHSSVGMVSRKLDSYLHSPDARMSYLLNYCLAFQPNLRSLYAVFSALLIDSFNV
jgi:hypothetical protein